jgi:acetylglutamate kinase
VAHKRIIQWDLSLIQSEKKPSTINYGFVGDVKYVNALLLELLYNGITVFCAITHDKKNQLLNTNADTSELAIALSTLYVTLTLLL